MSFTLALPQLSVSGTRALRDAICMIAQQGIRSALVLTDENLRGLDAGTLLYSLLDEKGIAYTVFSAIEPNPTVATVASAFAVFEAKRPDVLIALGGGSVIDTAKAVRLLSANPGPIESYEGVHHELKAGVMLVAVEPPLELRRRLPAMLLLRIQSVM